MRMNEPDSMKRTGESVCQCIVCCLFWSQLESITVNLTPAAYIQTKEKHFPFKSLVFYWLGTWWEILLSAPVLWWLNNKQSDAKVAFNVGNWCVHCRSVALLIQYKLTQWCGGPYCLSPSDFCVETSNVHQTGWENSAACKTWKAILSSF